LVYFICSKSGNIFPRFANISEGKYFHLSLFSLLYARQQKLERRSLGSNKKSGKVSECHSRIMDFVSSGDDNMHELLSQGVSKGIS
jgi:hypothetical protein